MTPKPKIFINYRRNDTQTEARLLNDFLSRYEIEKVFFDLESIEYGEDFWERISKEIRSCDKFLALIGTHWEFEINNKIEEDILIKEIDFAFKLKKSVIPVLFYRKMPNIKDLKELKSFHNVNEFVKINALPISNNNFEVDLKKLAEKTLKLQLKPLPKPENPEHIKEIKRLQTELNQKETELSAALQEIKNMKANDKSTELQTNIKTLEEEILNLKIRFADEKVKTSELQLKLNEFENPKTSISKFENFTEKIADESFDMIAIKGGSYKMGSNEDLYEKPIHIVDISDFYLSKQQITVLEFNTFITDTKYITEAEKDGSSWIISSNSWKKANAITWLNDEFGNKRPKSTYHHPVLHISWNDVQAYCSWLREITGKKYRLPSESEWEYAAGGGEFNRTKWSGTNNENELENFAWYASNSNNHTHKVSELQQNQIGIFDMSGNVWEWCEDDWHKSFENAPVDGSAWIEKQKGSSKVIRGGSWTDIANLCRISNRGVKDVSTTYYNLGFRIALSFK